MFGQQVLKDIFYVFYGAVAALNLAACLYLLLRRSNAIAPDITSPPRLRRWAAAFFGASALSHVWNMPVYMLTSEADVMQGYLVAGLLDCMTIGPLALMILIVMLQDRRRPLWPVGVVVAPFVAIMALSVATRSDALMPLLYACFVVMAAGIVAYMAVALKQYGRWLRDNYADLEHKELWQSFLVLAFILSGLGIYTFDIDALTYEYSLQMLDVALICYLLWRVETLSDLSLHTSDIGMANSEESYGGGGDYDIAQASHSEDDDPQTPPAEDGGHSPAIRQRTSSPLAMSKNIGPLLKQHCEQRQIYLQYDISLAQLAMLIGTNRVYLSRHFAEQGTTYNAYINGLRIRHFVSLYREAVQAHQPITVQQLAHQSGFRSYGTFNTAFKQCMGMTATEWMRTADEL